MAKIKVGTKYKEVTKMFESLTGSRMMYDVFCDWVTMTACSIQNTCCIGKQYEKTREFIWISSKSILRRKLKHLQESPLKSSE